MSKILDAIWNGPDAKAKEPEKSFVGEEYG